MHPQNALSKYKRLIKRLKTLPIKSAGGLFLLLISMLVVVLINTQLRFKKLNLLYNTDESIIAELTPLTSDHIYRCVYPRIRGKHFFTPLNKIEQTIRDCYSPLQAQINKVPPTTLQLTLSPPKIVALIHNPVTTHYGLLLSQNNTIIPYLIGKPTPEGFMEIIQSKQYNIIEINSYPAPLCCKEFITQLSHTLSKYADLTPYKLTVINKPQQLGYAKLILPDNSYVFFNYQADITSQMQKFLITYKGLHQRNIKYTYIDLRFDRVIIK